MLIAHHIAARDLPEPPKLVLVSAMLENNPNRKSVREFETTHRSWFRYRDKARWNDPDSTGGLRPTIFQFALIQAVRNRNSDRWGFCPDFVVDATFMQEVELQASHIASEAGLHNVLISGPPGAGKFALARLIHASRGTSGDLVLFDCLGKDNVGESLGQVIEGPSADLATVFFDRLEFLDPRAQGDVYQLLRGVAAGAGGLPLILWVTEDPSWLLRQVHCGGFRSDLWERLSHIPSLKIPSLADRRGEIRLIAERYLARKRPGIQVDSAVWPMLEEHEWPRNVQELVEVLDRALVNSARRLLICDDFALFRRSEPDEPAPNAEKRWHLFETVEKRIERLRSAIKNESIGEDELSRDEVIGRFGIANLKHMIYLLRGGTRTNDLAAQLVAGMAFGTLAKSCGRTKAREKI
jgi:hypothetical protein